MVQQNQPYQAGQNKDFRVSLTQPQEDFVFSPKQFPAFIAGWGCGKSLCLILRAMLYSRHIPENLGVIFRKEYVDLRDSTCQDFEKYTGLKINSQREVALPNKSKILFRHIEEMNNIQNINLGWYAVEQIDEMEADKEFYMLWGRLRRNITPSPSFAETGLPIRSGFVIGNVGRDWVRKLWKENKKEDYALFEATTFDNAVNLPHEFIQNMKNLEQDKPEIYKRFVMNDWQSEDTASFLIPLRAIDGLKSIGYYNRHPGDCIACDPASGGDECVIYVFKDNQVVESKYMYERDTMKVAGEIMVLSAKHEIDFIAIDSIGIGKGITDRLKELKKEVFPINSAESSSDQKSFYNLRAEMYWFVMKQIFDKQVPHMGDEELIRQLTAIKYKIVNSNGCVQIEHKSEIKKRLDRSCDRADCYVYGVWASQFVKNKKHYYEPVKYVN